MFHCSSCCKKSKNWNPALFTSLREQCRTRRLTIGKPILNKLLSLEPAGPCRWREAFEVLSYHNTIPIKTTNWPHVFPRLMLLSGVRSNALYCYRRFSERRLKIFNGSFSVIHYTCKWNDKHCSRTCGGPHLREMLIGRRLSPTKLHRTRICDLCAATYAQVTLRNNHSYIARWNCAHSRKRYSSRVTLRLTVAIALRAQCETAMTNGVNSYTVAQLQCLYVNMQSKSFGRWMSMRKFATNSCRITPPYYRLYTCIYSITGGSW